MQRDYNEKQTAIAGRKRTALSAALIFLAVPGVMIAGNTLLKDNNYMLISVIVLALVMLPFFMVFERRKPKARELVLIAVMAAITVCAHLICKVTVPLKAGTAIIIVCGIALGPEAGFLIGALGRFVLNFYAGHGPWSPWQMFCWGFLGFMAGLVFCRNNTDETKTKGFKYVIAPIMCVLFSMIVAYVTYLFSPTRDGEAFFGWRIYAFGTIGLILSAAVQRKRLPVNCITIMVFTFFCTFILYGGLLNIFTLISTSGMPGSSEVSIDALKMYYIAGAPYDFAHAGAAAIFNLVFGEKLIGKLERIKRKYGIYL